jgi:hypothetical protein
MQNKDKKLTKTLETGVKNNKQAWKEAYKQMDRYKSSSGKKISPENVNEPGEGQCSRIEVRVFHEDILSTLEAVLEQEFQPLVINSCGENFPLDALKTGASGKEYDMLRRTNYYNTIGEELFPLKGNDVIYSPEVYLFKTPDGKTYTKPKKYAMLSICPLKNPRLISIRTDGKSQDNYENARDEEIMTEKIDLMFKLAVMYEYDCLIIPDFGCGREGNPLNKIIDMFNNNIQKGLIRYIFFAVQNESSIKKDESFLHFHKYITRGLNLSKPPKSVKSVKFVEPVTEDIDETEDIDTIDLEDEDEEIILDEIIDIDEEEN